MKKIANYLINTIAPSAGFSEGKLKDNPGDNSGSGIVSQTHNDYLYAFMALISKYGLISDTDESENASDFMDTIERLSGLAHVNVADYSLITTYALNDEVFSSGIQWVSVQASNTGNAPETNPDWWVPVPPTKVIFEQFRSGIVMRAGADPVDDSTPSATYQTWIKYGIHNIGGTAGQNYQAYKVHLDNSVVTGDFDLETIFDPGGANEYRFIDTFAPLSGTRDLLDYRVTTTGEATEGNPYIVVMLPI